MLANFLDKTKPIIFVVLVAFFFILYFSLIFFGSTDITNEAISGWSIILNVVLYAAVFFFFNFVIGKNNLTYDNAYAFYLFTLFLLVLLDNPFDYQGPLLLLLQLLFLRKIYSLKSSKNVLQKLFDAGFWLAILSLIQPIFIIFWLLIIIAILVHQKLTVHTIVSHIAGFLAPIIIAYAYHAWYGTIPVFESLQIEKYQWDLSFFMTGKLSYFIWVVLGMTLISLIVKSPFTLTFKNTFRRNWLLLLFHFLVVVIIVILLPNKSNFNLVYTLFPATVIIANGIELIEKRIAKDVLFYLLFLMGVGYAFYL
ncbi:MAG: hypothetical protein CMB99_09255 [Flavobacteriaceae bacterium]|nr:hypothetical protein [Flavobacteriaceae bacterium]|tara:strand:- start:483303 stop:484232 length:930 start_codon:yes stop_codon:yes gene_type:complete